MILATKTLNILKVQKCPQKAPRSLKSRDMSNLKFSQNSEKWKFKSNLLLVKKLGDFFDGKDVSALQKLSVISKKM